MQKRILFFGMCIVILSCTESPIITNTGTGRLNSPSSMVLVPGQPYAIVANANVDLDETSGSLIVIDRNTNKLLMNTKFEIPSFAGDMFIDAARKKLYIPDRDRSLLVYQYKIPGSGGKAISFSEVEVPEPLNFNDEFLANGIRTDEGPTQALMIPGTNLGDLIMVTSQKGSVAMIPAGTLKLKDKDADGEFFGLRLFSSSNFNNASNFPGRGASRMTMSPTTGLVYVTSPLNNQVYVIDPVTQKIEAMIDFDSLAAPTVGIRDIVIDNNEIAYVAHSGLDSVIVVDVSSITRNGIPYEVVSPPIKSIITVGDGPEDLELTASGATLFVSNENEDSIYVVDTTLSQVTKRISLSKAKNPGRLILDETTNELFCLNFFSNNISVIDPTTFAQTGSIE